MELELRKYYNLRAAVIEANSKPFIIKTISDNNEVLHQWHTLIEDQGDIVVIIDELYITIITEFITVRGFSSAASLLEAYKKVSSKNFQKSKGFVKLSQISSVLQIRNQLTFTLYCMYYFILPVYFNNSAQKLQDTLKVKSFSSIVNPHVYE